MLKINGTNGVIDDNSIMYLIFLNAVVRHADPDANIRIEKHKETLQVTVFPAVPEFRQALLENILSMHKLLHLRTNFAKSTKMMKSLSYEIDLEN